MSNNDLYFMEEQDEEINFLGYFFKYLRYWYWIITFLCISFSYAYIYLKQYTPIYQVSATLLIKDEKKMNTEVLEKLEMGGQSKLVENEIELLKSRAMIGKVVDNLNLIVSYWKELQARDRELYTESPITLNTTEITDYAYANPLYIKIRSGKKYQLLDQDEIDLGTFDYSQLVHNKYGKFSIDDKDSQENSYPTPIKVVFQSRDGLIDNLINSLQISLINPKSSLIALELESAVPDKGKAILTNLLEEYTFTSLEDKNREAANTLRFIEERLKLVTAELSDVELNVEQYRKAKGITDLNSESTLFLGKVEENDSKLNELNSQLKVLNGVEEYLNSAQVGIVAPATMMGVSDPILNSYIVQLAKLELERSKLAQTVHPGNPYLETINNQMRSVKQAIKENLTNQKKSLNVTKRGLINLNNRLEKSISAIPQKEREYIGIKRQATIKENLYLLLLKTREETAISYASTVTDSRVVDAPFSKNRVIRPDRNHIYLMALLLGLAIPFALIALKEGMTNTVQSKKEIELKTGLKVFGEIGLKAKDEKGEIIDSGSKSFVSEQIRILRSNMQYLFTNENPGVARTILITSSTSGEGKSFVTLNIAASLALLNKRVIIIGLDMRKPKINQYLNISSKVGLSTYLIGKATPDEIIQVTALENVYIAASGPIPPNPSELLANGRLEHLLATIKGSFDYILIDTPPLSLVTDATLIAPYVDLCFYLIRHEKTPKLYLKHITDLNHRKIFKSLNLIFNAVNYNNSSDYGYGYGYGQEGLYGQESTQKSILDRLRATINTIF